MKGQIQVCGGLTLQVLIDQDLITGDWKITSGSYNDDYSKIIGNGSTFDDAKHAFVTNFNNTIGSK